MFAATCKRGLSLFLAVLLYVTALLGFGTTAAFAAGEQADVYLIAFPREGDANLDYSGAWGHRDLQFLNGWSLGRATYTVVRAMGSLSGSICYCIEPGVPQETGDSLSKWGEDFWENYPSDYNHTIEPYEIKQLIGRIMQYGYTGSISTSWRSQNEGADKLANAVATQLLIWETVVGERDADFAHIAPEGFDAIAEQVGEHHPLRSQILSHYSRIEANVQNHSRLPSFLSKSSCGAQDIELEWNGSEYTAALTDTNGVLGNYSFSGSGLSFSVSGSTLTITAKTAPEEPVTIKAEKKDSQRRGIITWSDGHYRPGSAAIQDLVTYAEPVNDPVTGYLHVKVSYGSAKIIKTSEDGMVSGIRFTITGNGINETVTTGENGEIQIDHLTPGAYTVTELAEDRYVPQESRTVCVVSGQTAEVPFHNTLKRGDLIVTKTSEDGLHEGVRFRLSGLSSSGTPVEEYAVTDSTGRAVFSGVPAGQDYTLEELDTAIRYVLPEAQTAAVAWNTITHQDFTNRLKKWRAEIVKRDGETGSAQGGATLAGAVYGVYHGDDRIDTYETDASGSFTTAEYPCGEDWTVREITPSQGYLLDETVYPVGAEAGNFTLEHNSLSLEVKEAVKKGSITGIKLDEQGELLPGAVFGLFRADCTDFTTENALLTAESAGDGSFSFENIPYGVWQVREIAAPGGYVLSDEIFPVQISENGAVIELGNLENRPVTGELELTKKDISDGRLLPGAGFRIKDAGGNVVVEGYTDENGIARFTLRYGKYTYEEFDAPEGYRIDTTPHEFEITEDGQIVKAEMTNKKIPTPDVPQTGDENNLGFWVGLGSIALGGAIACGILLAKRNRGAVE